MKHFPGLSIGILFLFTHALHAQPNPTFIARSQGQDNSRTVSGLIKHTHVPYRDAWYLCAAPSISYFHSYKAREIGTHFFGADLLVPNNEDAGVIQIEGQSYHQNSSPQRTPTAWLADYFYLSPDFMGDIVIEPTVINCVLDFDWYFGFDSWVEGLYARIQLPVTYTKWNLNFGERIVTKGSLPYPAGYFTAAELPLENLLSSFSAYAAGEVPTPPADDTTLFQPLKFARMERCAKTRTGLADLQLEVGYDWISREYYYLSTSLRAVAPTGNKIRAHYVFDAQLGNGNHWEVGAGLSARGVWWHSDDGLKQWSIALDMSLFHYFTALEQRTFDLKNKPNSRYMLASRLGTPVTNLTTANGTPTAQFKQEYAPVANLTTLNVNVSAALEADFVLWLNYASYGFCFDFGYNLWARTCEDICVTNNCDTDCMPSIPTLIQQDQQDTWALKGDARMFGFIGLGDAVALSATESNAIINHGTSQNLLDGSVNDVNTTIDNPIIAESVVPAAPLANTAVGGFPINTSLQPIFLSASDINIQGITGISHKIFTYLSYTWEFEHWRPFVGIGASIEMGSTAQECSPTACSDSSCVNAALSFWGFYIKAGTSFRS